MSDNFVCRCVGHLQVKSVIHISKSLPVSQYSYSAEYSCSICQTMDYDLPVQKNHILFNCDSAPDSCQTLKNSQNVVNYSQIHRIYSAFSCWSVVNYSRLLCDKQSDVISIILIKIMLDTVTVATTNTINRHQCRFIGHGFKLVC